MKIFITGGCGYKGSVLIPKLLKEGYSVTNLDTQWFGNHIKSHENLEMINSDIREIDELSLEGFHSVIHLANIANDPAVELNQSMSWEVNVLAGHQLIEKAKNAGVKQFIFASSEVFMDLRVRNKSLKIYL